MTTRILVFATLALLSCRGNNLGGVESGFEVEPTTLDFGRVLEGAQVERKVKVRNTGRVTLVVEITTEGPFSAPGTLELPSGGEVELAVTFTAPAGVVSSTLRLSAQERSRTVSLTGEGVPPLQCTPSQPCRHSRFDLETSSCVESIAPDGSSCDVPSACLQNGVCQEGSCVGAARSCDDQNPCTEDACAPEVGCVHSPVACPMPTAPCRVPICMPETGCGDTAAADGTPCGPADCVTAHLCLAGACQALPTPDGFPCAPKTPCQGEGRCSNKVCVRPDAGEMTPAYTLSVPLIPSRVSIEEPALFAHNGNLYFESCDAPDGDGGCALTSITGSGFVRFVTPHPSYSPRQLLTVSDAGVLSLTSDALELHAASGGALSWSRPLASWPAPPELVAGVPVVSKDRVAELARTGWFAAFSWLPPEEPLSSYDAGEPDAGTDGGSESDGGEAGEELDAGPPLDDAGVLFGVETLVRLQPDGGSVELTRRSAGNTSVAAVDSRDRVYLYTPSTGAVARWEEDGGLSTLGFVPAGEFAERALLVSGEHLWVGGQHFISLRDGGFDVTGSTSWERAPERLELLRRHLLMDERGEAVAFYRSCESPASFPCDPSEKALTVRALATDGGTRWESRVLPGGVPGRLEEAALVAIGKGVATLTQVSFDGGLEAHLQVFSEGKRVFACPLPPAGELGGAVFDRDHVYVLVKRSDAWKLEAYDLESLPLATQGWPQRDGVSGTRRER